MQFLVVQCIVYRDNLCTTSTSVVQCDFGSIGGKFGKARVRNFIVQSLLQCRIHFWVNADLNLLVGESSSLYEYPSVLVSLELHLGVESNARLEVFCANNATGCENWCTFVEARSTGSNECYGSSRIYTYKTTSIDCDNRVVLYRCHVEVFGLSCEVATENCEVNITFDCRILERSLSCHFSHYPCKYLTVGVAFLHLRERLVQAVRQRANRIVFIVESFVVKFVCASARENNVLSEVVYVNSTTRTCCAHTHTNLAVGLGSTARSMPSCRNQSGSTTSNLCSTASTSTRVAGVKEKKDMTVLTQLNAEFLNYSAKFIVPEMEATIVTFSHFHRSVVANEAFVKTIDFVAVVVKNLMSVTAIVYNDLIAFRNLT